MTYMHQMKAPVLRHIEQGDKHALYLRYQAKVGTTPARLPAKARGM